MSYENRIALGNLVPTIGQFKVMDKIPQYQQCEVHNLVEAPAEVPEVLRHVVFNIERGQTLHETIDFLNMCPDFKNMDIIYAMTARSARATATWRMRSPSPSA